MGALRDGWVREIGRRPEVIEEAHRLHHAAADSKATGNPSTTPPEQR